MLLFSCKDANGQICQYPGARDVSGGVMWSSADARRSWCWQPRSSIRPWHWAAPVIKTDTKPIIHTGDKQRHNNPEWCHNHCIIELTKVPYGPIHSFSLHTNNAWAQGTSLKSTWVRVKILTCRNFVTHIVISNAYSGLHSLSIDCNYRLQRKMKLNEVLYNQFTWTFKLGRLRRKSRPIRISVKLYHQTDSNIFFGFLTFHVLGGLSLSSGFTQREISNSSRTTTKFIKRFHDMETK